MESIPEVIVEDGLQGDNNSFGQEGGMPESSPPLIYDSFISNDCGESAASTSTESCGGATSSSGDSGGGGESYATGGNYYTRQEKAYYSLLAAPPFQEGNIPGLAEAEFYFQMCGVMLTRARNHNREDWRTLREAVDVLFDKNLSLKRQLVERDTDIQKLQKAIEMERSKTEQAVKEYQPWRKQAIELNEKLASVNDQLVAQIEVTSSLKTEMEILKAEASEKVERIKMLEESREQLEAEKVKLTSKCSSLSKDVDTFKLTCASLETSVARLNEKEKVLSESVAKKEKEIQRANRKLESEKKANQKALKSQERQVRAVESDNGKLTAEVEELRNALEKERESVMDLEDRRVGVIQVLFPGANPEEIRAVLGTPKRATGVSRLSSSETGKNRRDSGESIPGSSRYKRKLHPSSPPETEGGKVAKEAKRDATSADSPTTGNNGLKVTKDAPQSGGTSAESTPTTSRGRAAD